MLIDAHAHLDAYGDSLPAALAAIRRLEVFTVATSMDLPSYKNLREIGAREDLVLPTFGVHPKRAPRYADDLAALGRVIDETPAIGEIGLDFHWVEDASQYAAQEKVLEYFLAAAREQHKLVNLHTKGAERRIIDLLERYDIRRAIVHWYSGPLDILHAFAEFGAYFTVGVELPRSRVIQEIARAVPDHLLLTETDNPGGLRWLTGDPGMPGEIVNVVTALAAVRGVSAESVERTVNENFLRLIAGDPWLEAAYVLLSRTKGTGSA